MGRTIAIANQKGGVGKTTSSVNLSACLDYLGKKVLLIDIDPQGNATSGVGVNKGDVDQCIYEILIDDVDVKDTIMETKVENLHVVPATISLAGAEIELVSTISREARLKNDLAEVKDLYDYIIIDCPPSLGLLTLNSLTASDGIIIPVQCEYYALEGLSQLLSTVRLVQKHLNHDLMIDGVLLTMYDARDLTTHAVAAPRHDVRDVHEIRIPIGTLCLGGHEREDAPGGRGVKVQSSTFKVQSSRFKV